MKNEPLTTYLNDHLAGATMGKELVESCLASNAENPLGDFLAQLLSDIGEERGVLKGVLERLGSRTNPVKKAVTWLGEKASRVKLGGAAGTYSDLNRLEELELLLLGVRGKPALWQALEAVADERLRDVDFATLSARAQRAAPAAGGAGSLYTRYARLLPTCLEPWPLKTWSSKTCHQRYRSGT